MIQCDVPVCTVNVYEPVAHAEAGGEGDCFLFILQGHLATARLRESSVLRTNALPNENMAIEIMVYI